jgi:hypothetical protein
VILGIRIDLVGLDPDPGEQTETNKKRKKIRNLMF